METLANLMRFCFPFSFSLEMHLLHSSLHFALFLHSQETKEKHRGVLLDFLKRQRREERRERIFEFYILPKPFSSPVFCFCILVAFHFPPKSSTFSLFPLKNINKVLKVNLPTINSYEEKQNILFLQLNPCTIKMFRVKKEARKTKENHFL